MGRTKDARGKAERAVRRRRRRRKGQAPSPELASSRPLRLSLTDGGGESKRKIDFDAKKRKRAKSGEKRREPRRSKKNGRTRITARNGKAPDPSANETSARNGFPRCRREPASRENGWKRRRDALRRQIFGVFAFGAFGDVWGFWVIGGVWSVWDVFAFRTKRKRRKSRQRSDLLAFESPNPIITQETIDGTDGKGRLS